jgi:hypothetical protein
MVPRPIHGGRGRTPRAKPILGPPRGPSGPSNADQQTRQQTPLCGSPPRGRRARPSCLSWLEFPGPDYGRGPSPTPGPGNSSQLPGAALRRPAAASVDAAPAGRTTWARPLRSSISPPDPLQGETSTCNPQAYPHPPPNPRHATHKGTHTQRPESEAESTSTHEKAARTSGGTGRPGVEATTMTTPGSGSPDEP